MKAVGILAAVIVGVAMFAAVRFANTTLAPLFLNSRIERLGEKDLPKIVVERGKTIYCRMKADDFRFPLPPGSRVVNQAVSGGFDTVDGSVEVRFDDPNAIIASEYRLLLSGKTPVGGEIRTRTIPGGLVIKFHYFGDR
jgi:hypothetical protein